MRRGTPIQLRGSTSDDGFLYNTWAATATTTGYDSLDASVRQQMQQACIDPGFAVSNPNGGIWARNHGTRFAKRGGAHYGVDWRTGLFALSLISPRSEVSFLIGFRLALVQ